MKYLFINPPTYINNWAPIVGVPTLIGILEKAGVETEFIDLNLDYCSKLISKEGINELICYFNNIISCDNFAFDFFKIEKEKFKKIINNLEHVKNKIDFCRNAAHKNNLFSDFLIALYITRNFTLIIENSNLILKDALNHFMPDIINFRSGVNEPEFEVKIDELLSFLNSDYIPFKNFCDEEIEKIINKKPNIIGISINHQISIFSGLYIAYKLKQKTNIHINIGGSYFNYFYKLHNNLDKFFGIFFDSISIGNNTRTVTDIIKYLENKIPIDEVPNIIYLREKELKVNISEKVIPINELPFESFTGYNFNKYLYPETCLPVVASNSCYWHKCNFCECCGKKYNVKSPKRIVEELEHLSKKYNVKYFYFWDNAIHPKILDEMSDLIIQKKLNIKYSIYARFEKEFTAKSLKKLKKSGCLYINFGLDTASENMLNFINKGINLETVKIILKNCYKAGIGTNAYLILGHPNETKEDIHNNIKFIKKNIKYIDVLEVISKVLFIDGSKINNERDKYRALIKTSQKERDKYAEYMKKLCKSQIELFNFSLFIVLYISNKGILRYRLEKKIFYFFRNHPKIIHIYIMFYKLFYFNRKHI